DYTKVGKDTMWQTISVDGIDVLVTDAKADHGEIEGLRRDGVEVIIAGDASSSSARGSES
ncbi:MAG TPA: DeoR family transcriptional regulator, partial [Acidimicrobiia bacterium]